MKNKILAMKNFLENLAQKNPAEPEFLQAAKEVVENLAPFLEKNKKYADAKILERICEPERTIIFRVPWTDDRGEIQINRGFRVQMNSAIGPYKGGLRFHPSVNLGILKFLAFEQIFKNSLTGLPMGGGKGGADFDPKNKSDAEVMRFCQSFMTELSRHIDENTDVPAGDIGVGGREIGFLFGQYKKLRNKFVGVLTGKNFEFGGSLIRPEATGFGVVFFAEEILKKNSDSLKNKKCVISGSGNVAQFCAEKILKFGGKILTMSDSSGFIFCKNGIDNEKLNFLKILKNEKRGRIFEMEKKFADIEFFKNEKPWKISCDAAFPCATQNEILKNDAENLIKNGCKIVVEGANMPANLEAVEIFLQNKIFFAPGKASNAGGVAVSGLEMSQNSMRQIWTAEKVETELQKIMKNIHEKCVKFGAEKNFTNYVRGANIGGFIKVADAMLAQGLV